MNPKIGTHLGGKVRDEAQADAAQLKLELVEDSRTS